MKSNLSKTACQMPSCPNLGEYLKVLVLSSAMLSFALSQSSPQAAWLERQGLVQRQGPGGAEVVAGTIPKLKRNPHESEDHS